MDQLELVFRLLVRLQFMYFQYNVYLSIVVRTNKYIYIYIYIYNTHVIQNNLRTPQLAGFARQLGCKKPLKFVLQCNTYIIVFHFNYLSQVIFITKAVTRL